MPGELLHVGLWRRPYVDSKLAKAKPHQIRRKMFADLPNLKQKKGTAEAVPLEIRVDPRNSVAEVLVPNPIHKRS